MAGFTLSTVLSILSMIGFGFVTYEGFSSVIDNLVSVATSSWQGAGGNVMMILDMAGFTDALGYMLSAVTTKAGMAATKRFLPK
jgi:hypothetical protein